jgi:hypothetical protein
MGIRTKKGVFFSIDALIALAIILLTVMIAVPLIYESHKSSPVKNDLMISLSILTADEINNTLIRSLIDEGQITNANVSVLEAIGHLYVRNISLAKNVAQSILDELNLKENIGIWYNEDLIASINKSVYENAENVEVDRQIISGIGKGQDIDGFVAKAWLKKIDEKRNSKLVRGDFVCGDWRNYSWGNYCGSTYNKIVYNVNIPLNSTIENATWLIEGSWINQFVRAFVNGNRIFEGQINYYRIFDITPYLHEGNNELFFNSTQGGDDGASFILVDYKTSQMRTYEYEKRIPFNIVQTRSVLHYEKPVFLPNEISGMNLTINSSVDVSLSIRKGVNTIFIGKKSSLGGFVYFNDSEIVSKLSSNGITYSDLSNEYFYVIIDMGKDFPAQQIVLGNNSFIEFAFSGISMPYGTIDISQKIQLTNKTNHLQHTFYRDLLWEYHIPKNAIPVLADWQFGWLSTTNSETYQKADANSITLFESPPEDFKTSFNRYGFTPNRAEGVIVEGKNNFSLEFGENYGVSSEASNGFLTYFIKSYVNYGDAKSKAVGGTRLVEFEDGTTKTISIGNSSDIWDPENDALDDAVERLISQLDSDNNSKIDLLIGQDEIDIDAIDISGVPYIWQTEVQIRSWR